MPEQAQSKYMNLNEFLETFFAAQDANEDRIGYFPNMVKDNESVQSLYQIIGSFAQDLGPNTRKLFEQYWNARNDNSPAAADFLNMVKTITVWYADNNGRQGLEDSCKSIMYLCKNGKIENPEYALRLLKSIESQFQQKSTELHLSVARMIAENPVATPHDLYKYASMFTRGLGVYGTPTSLLGRPENQTIPEDLMGMLNDHMVRTDANIGNELHKDFPNVDAIERMGGGSLIYIAEAILSLVKFQAEHNVRSQNDVNEIEKIVAVLRDKYNIEHILGLEKKPYGPEYEKLASLKLAKLEPQYEKMERDLSTAQKSQHDMRGAYNERVEKLQEKIAELERELRQERTKNAALKATVNTYIKMAEARVGGSVLNIRKDMSDELGRLKRDIEDGRGSI